MRGFNLPASLDKHGAFLCYRIKRKNSTDKVPFYYFSLLLHSLFLLVQHIMFTFVVPLLFVSRVLGSVALLPDKNRWKGLY